jgi:probable selenium-dependent hydroxylase accessory protein YqeC
MTAMGTLYNALDINLTQNELASFIGAGGKTTALFALAKELKSLGKKVLVTTTTAMYHPEGRECDEVVVDSSGDSSVFAGVKENSITVLGREVSLENKLLGVDKRLLDEFYEKKIFNYILVEADGAKHRPLKAPAPHEPVVPAAATKVIGVIGLDALGKKIGSDYVHRPELFCEVTRSTMDALIDEETIVRVIISPEGLFKGVTESCHTYLLLNKADGKERKRSAIAIIESVKKHTCNISGFIVATLIEGRIDRIK